MKKSRIFGVLFIVGGIASILLSNYISEQVKEGKIKIERSQKTVDEGSKLFSLNPKAKEVGKELTDSAQKKIDRGKVDVAHYTRLSHILMISGIAAVLVGAGLIVYSFRGPEKKR